MMPLFLFEDVPGDVAAAVGGAGLAISSALVTALWKDRKASEDRRVILEDRQQKNIEEMTGALRDTAHATRDLIEVVRADLTERKSSA